MKYSQLAIIKSSPSCYRRQSCLMSLTNFKCGTSPPSSNTVCRSHSKQKLYLSPSALDAIWKCESEKALVKAGVCIAERGVFGMGNWGTSSKKQICISFLNPEHTEQKWSLSRPVTHFVNSSTTQLNNSAMMLFYMLPPCSKYGRGWMCVVVTSKFTYFCISSFSFHFTNSWTTSFLIIRCDICRHDATNILA